MQEFEITIKVTKKEDGSLDISHELPIDTPMVDITNILVASIEALQKKVETYLSQIKVRGSDEEIKAFIYQITPGQIAKHELEKTNAESQQPKANS